MLYFQRFYRYHKLKSLRAGSESRGPTTAVPYWHIFKKAFPQLLNVFLVFFVTLSVFPTVLAGQWPGVGSGRGQGHAEIRDRLNSSRLSRIALVGQVNNPVT